jgi:protein-S-isoprenylcysteine O-methyltransferase Ste14
MKTSYLVKQLFGTILFFGLIFISAGRLDYWQGLVFAGAGLVMFVLSYTLLKMDPELARERSNPGEGVKKWDKMILLLSFLCILGMYVVAGLDTGRFHWSPGFHWSLYAAGILLSITGQLLFLIAQKQNKFFSSTVRIQTERGHQVCDTGLYSFVRHPAYLGTIIQTLGFPFFFGSVWAGIPALIAIILLVLRTSLEDRTLMQELNGYREYAGKITYRILPYIW